MGRFGSVRVIGQSGLIHGSVWVGSGRSGVDLGRFGSILGRFGSVQVSLGQSRSIHGSVRVGLGRFGLIRVDLGRFGSVWVGPCFSMYADCIRIHFISITSPARSVRVEEI